MFFSGKRPCWSEPDSPGQPLKQLEGTQDKWADLLDGGALCPQNVYPCIYWYVVQREYTSICFPLGHCLNLDFF